MKIKREKPIMHRVSMSSKEIIFALFAFRKVYEQEHFMSVRMRLNNALHDMGEESCGAKFDEATKQYENLFQTVPDSSHYAGNEVLDG